MVPLNTFRLPLNDPSKRQRIKGFDGVGSLTYFRLTFAQTNTHIGLVYSEFNMLPIIYKKYIIYLPFYFRGSFGVWIKQSSLN